MQDLILKYKTHFPKGHFLNLEDKNSAIDFLTDSECLNLKEQVLSLNKAGEGNMNLALRVKTNQRSFILKQSRPWVEKFQSIDAPVARNQVEYDFYLEAQKSSFLKSMTPKMIHRSSDSNVIMMQDLGSASDYMHLYQGKKISISDAQSLVKMLKELHAIPVKNPQALSNQSMRDLNHAHMYVIPYQEDNGLDLESITPGLKKLLKATCNDQKIMKKISALGNAYIHADQGSLLHGDYYPGSWLNTASGLKVIDPEFCFVGPKEFDYAILWAHFIMSDEDVSALNLPKDLDLPLLKAFAGAEILRRIYGYAQLPLKNDINHKEALIKKAHALLLTQNAA